jgi:hypothetical protein
MRGNDLGNCVTVYGPDGSPLSGVSVTTTDTRTGGSRTSQTNASGLVLERWLAVGGPHHQATAELCRPDRDGNRSAAGRHLHRGAAAGFGEMEEVVVTGAQIVAADTLGPSSYSASRIWDMPAVNRDLRHRPKRALYVDPAFAGGAIHCAGANPASTA